MKHYTCLRTACILLLLFIHSLTSHSSDTLIVQCSKRNACNFQHSPEKLTGVKCLVLEGYESGMNWEKLIPSCAGASSLTEIIFDSNGFEELPASLSLLHQVHHITILGSEELDPDAAAETLANMPMLEKITWELYGIDEVPYKISELPRLDSIIVVNTMFSDQRRNYDDVMHDPSVQRITFEIPVRTKYPRQPYISGVFITPRTDEFPMLPESYSEEVQSLTGNDFVYSRARRVDTPSFPFNRNFENVKPPIEGLNVEKEFYAVQSDQPTVISSSVSGTAIVIPPRAFVDANGNPVTGEVTVDYREFRDAADFIVSGIPMSFTHDNDLTFFKSGGMFEINASQNGNEVFLKEGSEIALQFVSTDHDNYNFYNYDDAKNEWITTSVVPDAVAMTVPETSGYSQAVQFYLMLTQNPDNPGAVDTVCFADRFNDLSYGYSSKRTRFPEPRNIRITKVRKSRGGHVVFDIERINNTNPELAQLRAAHWMLDMPISANDFKQSFSRKKGFCDMRVEQDDNGYILRFKSDSCIWEFAAHPVNLVTSDHKKFYDDQKVNYANYSKALSRREKAFNRKIRHRVTYMQRMAQQHIMTEERAWKNCVGLMTTEEQALAFNDWKTYCMNARELEKANLKSRVATGDNLVRSLSIDGFGIYNCDQIERLKKPIDVYASYQDTSGKSLQGKCTYVIDRSINAVLAYDGHYGYNTHKIALDPSTVASVLLVDNEGNVAVAGSDSLDPDKFRDAGSFRFEMDKSTKPLTVAELREKLKL